MKIKHNIVRDGCNLSGQILDVDFEDIVRGAHHMSSCEAEGVFCLRSNKQPQLGDSGLFVWGSNAARDYDVVSCSYDSPEQAQQVLDYINEFNMPYKPKRGDIVEVSDSPENGWKKRIFLTSIEGAILPHLAVMGGGESNFESGIFFNTTKWKCMREIKPVIGKIPDTEIEFKITQKNWDTLDKRLTELEERTPRVTFVGKGA
ncbi:MAG: hypothetical protein ACTSW1_08320 [Candidatus Hodarchaeales archaeon]